MHWEPEIKRFDPTYRTILLGHIDKNDDKVMPIRLPFPYLEFRYFQKVNCLRVYFQTHPLSDYYLPCLPNVYDHGTVCLDLYNARNIDEAIEAFWSSEFRAISGRWAFDVPTLFYKSILDSHGRLMHNLSDEEFFDTLRKSYLIWSTSTIEEVLNLPYRRA